MWPIFFIIAFAGCRAGSPTATEEAPKPVTQEFPCEATILDTVIQVVVYSEEGYLRRLNIFENFIYLGDGVYSEETYIYFGGSWDPEGPWPQSAAIFTRGPKHFELVQVFDNAACNADFKRILLQEIRSSERKVEQYTCAVHQVEKLMDSMWLDTECDINCWDGMEARKTRAYERYQYYQEELQNARHIFRYFFEDSDCE